MPAIASPRTLPLVNSLSDAVREVIASNRSDGYPPNRFAGVTEDGTAPNLVGIVSKLINDGHTLLWLENELQHIPTLLTIEDFVSRHGTTWGFSASTIQMAQARVTRFDQVAGFTRYI